MKRRDHRRVASPAGVVRAAGVALAPLVAAGGCDPTWFLLPVTDSCTTPGVICTVAGTGMAAFDGDGRAALGTSFYYPLDVEFDASGQPLVLDFNNLRIRRIEPDGTVRTVMGLDYEDFPVNGAAAVDTPLHHASDIEMSLDGYLYVAGDHLPIVVRVNPAGIVEWFAGTTEFGNDGDGGPALGARMTTPFGLAPDAAGGVYIADQYADVVRYVDPAGIIRTVAGNGTRGYSGDGGPATAAQLSGPTRLRLDPAGDLLICDTLNHAVRRVRLASGIIETICGDGQPGNAGDGGPATAARLRSPYDLRYSPAGDLYIADSGNNCIRRIDAAGMITTVIGSGVEGFSGDGGDGRHCALDGPSGVHFDRHGAMWICDTFNHRVRRVAGFLAADGL